MKNYSLTIFLSAALLPFLSCAASYTVTTTNDTGPGSLRAVITTASGVVGPHSIGFATTGQFGGGGTINLLSPLPQIAQSVTIAGWRNPGSTNNAITVTGSPFVFGPGTSNSVQQLNIVGSITNGQSIWITECVITNGGIESTGVLQIISSSVMSSPSAGLWSLGNATLNGVTVSLCSGGGIHNEGTMAIADSVISSNTSPANGAGIYSFGSLQVARCKIFENLSSGNGGGLFNSATCSVAQSSISGNSAVGGAGFFSAAGTLWVDSSCVVSNVSAGQAGFPGTGSVGGSGGGVLGGVGGVSDAPPYGPAMTGGNGGFGSGGGGGYANASVAKAGNGGAGGWGGGGGGAFGGSLDNGFRPVGAGSPGQYGGAGGSVAPGCIYGPARCGGGGGGAGFGGGLFAESGSINITNCTISGNQARGGNGGAGGPMQAANNCGPNPPDTGGGGGGAGLGGGIFLNGASLILVNCSTVNNTVYGGSGVSGGGNGQGVGGGIFILRGTVSSLNTIAAQNIASSTNVDVVGTFSSLGYNFIGNISGSSGWNPVTDYQNAVPLALGPLQDNGGPTFTCALLPGSLCILAGTSVGAPTTDQRGVIRPLGRCDIGAYQYTTLLVPTITWTNPAHIVYGMALTSAQLNASANIGGSFTYAPPAGTILNAGSDQVLIAIFTPADPNTAASATNSVLITVLKADQTIAFDSIPAQTVNAPPIILSANASSGLPVTFSLVSGPALLAGNVLSVGAAPGLVIVRASQPGNTNYNAAPDVAQSFLVVTNAMPIITAQPTNLTVDLGDDALFSVSATTAPLNYQWRFNGLELPGATNSVLFLPRTTANQAGPYRVVVRNPLGAVTSVVAVLTVLAPPGVPEIVSQPRSQVVRARETASFSVGATGAPTLLYQWYQGASPNTNSLIPGATASTYTTPPLSTNGSCWVSVRNSLGMVDSTPATVTVLPTQTPKLSLQITAGFPVITLEGQVGTNYVIQYKNSLSDPNWTPLLGFTLSLNPFIYFDTTASGQVRRYYRAYGN